MRKRGEYFPIRLLLYASSSCIVVNPLFPSFLSTRFSRTLSLPFPLVYFRFYSLFFILCPLAFCPCQRQSFSVFKIHVLDVSWATMLLISVLLHMLYIFPFSQVRSIPRTVGENPRIQGTRENYVYWLEMLSRLLGLILLPFEVLTKYVSSQVTTSTVPVS